MNAPVITLTLNPAIDQTITLDDLHPGSVHRARQVRFDAGGKGVNVASCLADWGIPVIATGFLGDANDAVFTALFAAKRITDRFARLPGDTRVNIKLVHAGGTTDINLSGLTVTADKLAELGRTILGAIEPGAIIVLAGSVPAGVTAGFYRDLTAALAERGARVLLDTSGEPLAAALAEGALALPFCIKPNRAELESWAGHPLPDMPAILAAARRLIRRGVQRVVVSLGENGALFVTQSEALLAALKASVRSSTVGAGDAMVAGIGAALREEATLERMARLATAFAVGKLALAGANLPPRAEIEARAEKVAVVPVTENPSGGFRVI